MREAEEAIDEAHLICAERVPGVSFEHLALHWRISTIGRMIQAEQAAVARQEGLTINNAHLLLSLRLHAGPMRPSDLSGQHGLTNAGITGCLDRLEEDGLIYRTPSAHDRRVREVTLTEAGTRAADRLFQRCAQEIRALRILQNMPPAARNLLNNQLRRLLKQLSG